VRAVIAAALFAATTAACHKDDGQVRLARVIEALDKAGFKASGLPSADPGRLSAQRCVGGTLEDLEVNICEYGAAEAVHLGKKAAEAWVGTAVTGVALENGLTVLTVADRGRADPTGAKLQKISKAYLALGRP
jgi:hypothetical protein